MTSRAFLLRPDTPEEGMPRPPRPGEEEGRLSEPLQTSALEAGLTKMRPPTWRSSSLRALEASEHAKERGRFAELHDRLYQAYWEEGRDIGREEVLQEAAEAAGLEWTSLKEVLDSGKYRPAVLEQYQEALELGFHGIPAFVIGDFRFTGAQPMRLFRAVAERATAMLQKDPKAFAGGRPSSGGLAGGGQLPDRG